MIPEIDIDYFSKIIFGRCRKNAISNIPVLYADIYTSLRLILNVYDFKTFIKSKG